MAVNVLRWHRVCTIRANPSVSHSEIIMEGVGYGRTCANLVSLSPCGGGSECYGVRAEIK